MELGGTTWPALLGVATALGVRHGYDADHLTVIDGLVRRNARTRPQLAGAAGLLFSLGHGAVVVAVACAAVIAARRWQPAPWLNTTAEIATVVILVLLAVLNLRNLLCASNDGLVAPVGLRSRPFRKMLSSDRPWTLAAVGVLFAISPDSLTIAATLGLAASAFDGVEAALVAASCFTFGMILATGLNGYCVARMVLTSDRRGALAGRIMTFAVALTSLAVAGSILSRLLWPARDTLAFEGGWGGALVIVVVVSAFLLSLLAGRVTRILRRSRNGLLLHANVPPAT